MTEQQMTPQMAVGFLASAIKSGEPFTEQCEQAVSIAMAALSHAEGEAPPVALEALAFVAQAGDAVSSLHLTKFEECISTIRAALSRPEGQAVGVVEPADHQALAAWLGDKPRRMAVAETSPASIQSLPEGTKLYTHPAPAGELRPDCSVCGDFGSDCDVCGGPSQQPVSDPDGLAAAERPGALMEAAGLLKIARSKMGADDDECESDEEAARWRRMAAVEDELRKLVKQSRPAPDEREIAALLEQLYGTLERAIPPADESPEEAVADAMALLSDFMERTEKQGGKS